MPGGINHGQAIINDGKRCFSRLLLFFGDNRYIYVNKPKIDYLL